MTSVWLEPAAGAKFSDLGPPKRDFPCKNIAFGEVFEGENTKILKILHIFKNPPLLQIRD